MSHSLLTYVHNYLSHPFDCSTFCDEYSRQWNKERDSGELLHDDVETSELLSRIFCLVDLFNPASDREAYELDELSLKDEILKVLNQI